MRKVTSKFAIWENSRWRIIGDCKATIEKLKQLDFKTSDTALYRMKPEEVHTFRRSYRDEHAESQTIKKIS